MSGRWSATSFLLACVLLLVSMPMLYASSVVRDEDRFVAVSADMIRQSEVRNAIADRVAELAITSIELDETLAATLPPAIRPFSVPIAKIGTRELTSATLRTLDTPAVRALFDVSLREVHRQLTVADGDVVIDLRAVLVRAARELGGPALGFAVADTLATSDVGRFVLFEASDAGDTPVVNAVRTTRLVGVLLLAGAALAFVASVAAASGRRRRVFDVGVGIVAVALTSVLLVDLAAGLIADGPVAGAVAGVVVSHYVASLSGLIGFGLAVAIGAVLVGTNVVELMRDLVRARQGDRAASGRIVQAIAARAALVRCAIWTATILTLRWWNQPTGRVVVTVLAFAAVAHLVVWLATSSSPRAARVRAEFTGGTAGPAPGVPLGRLRIELLALALLVLVLWPAWNLGLVVDVVVVTAVVQLLLDAVPAVRRRAAERSEAAGAAEVVPRNVRRSVVVAVATGAVLVTVGTVATASSVDGIEQREGCNGSVELCDRRIDEITFAGSHNSMSSTELGWQLAMQTGDIVAQLDHGIRALLIDTHYWASSATGSVEGADDEAAKAVIEAALAGDVPRPGTWLCHGFCALGATDLTAALADIRFWLEGNPDEVVLMVIQDAITTEDTFAAFEASGLIDHVHQHEPGTPFPTLRELIELDERLLVYAEQAGSPDSWYQNAYAETFAETPYAFDVAADFTCVPNRGDEDNPLFLINHWVTTGIPVRDAAKRVNSAAVLANRVEQCREERGRTPTVLAVDFAQTGDLVRFVAELNGV